MDRFYFTQYSHHSNVGDEITLLDEVLDRYIILSKSQSRSLMDHMRHGITSPIGMRLANEGIISIDNGVPISDSIPPSVGVGLLQWTSSTTAASGGVSIIKMGSALTALIWAHRTLAKYGLHECLQQSRKRLDRMNHSALMPSEKLVMAEDYGFQIKKIAPYMPFKVKCLEFSLALHYILTEKGIESKFLIGYQRYDFLSHAWIEVSGMAILDERELSAKIIPILRIGK